MEMRVLLVNGEAYCDSERQDDLVRRTLDAIQSSAVALEASELFPLRLAALQLTTPACVTGEQTLGQRCRVGRGQSRSFEQVGHRQRLAASRAPVRSGNCR